MGFKSPNPSFSAPAEEVTFAGLLFDMDGTIIDSTAAVETHWKSVGQELGLNSEEILRTSHGRRSIDILKILSPANANWEYVSKMEGLIPTLYGTSATPIPGAHALLTSVTTQHVPWAIVTSGTKPLVSGWLSILGLPTPDHIVTAEDVENGKPDPQGYLMGLAKLGLGSGVVGSEANVLVLEDSPAGIRAGKAAGCRVLGVVTSHAVEQVVAAGADYVVRDLRSVRVVGYDGGKGGVTLEIRDAWVA